MGRCKFKIEKITYSKHSVEQRITSPKMSLRCIGVFSEILREDKYLA